MLEETKLKANEKIKCEAANDFQIFHLNRQNSQGGGIAVGVEKNIESTLVREGDDKLEVISVQVVLGKIPVRLVVGYGPQENDEVEKKKNFWNFIENELTEAELEGHGIMIQMDGNLHAGDLVKGDPNPQNKNGKMFRDFLNRNKSLVVLNCLETCKGVITRTRKTEIKTEEAVLDFFLINDKLRPFFKEMIIDEERNFCLSNIAQIKKNGRIIETDHNAMIAEFNLTVDAKKPVREEMFNFRNRKCQEAFKEATEMNEELLDCFDNNLEFKDQSKTWLKCFNSVIRNSFRKVRIVDNKKKQNVKMRTMLNSRIEMKQNMKKKNISEEMRDQIEFRIKQI